MKTITIICPLYQAGDFIEKLHNSLLMQENVDILNISYILTESTDKTEDYLKENNISYKKIKKSEFSHSLVRENAAFESKADIIVFITQDVVIEDKKWLYYLTKDIDGTLVASYSRQVTKYDNLEKYTREKNYPDMSSIVTKDDIKDKGLRTFFFSDAASAINRSVFEKMNGYDHKNLPISEDMYIAYKIIMNGYRIKYCADSVVFHSHNFTLKQIYERYKLTGQFMRENSYLDQYGTNESGFDMAKYILKRIFQEHNYKLLYRYPLDMAARYIGMKIGKNTAPKTR